MEGNSKTGSWLDFNLLKRIIGLANPYKNAFRASIMLSVLLALVGPIRPRLVQYTIDNFIIQLNMHMLTVMCGWMLLLLVTEAVLRYVFNYLTAWLGQSIIRDMRVKIFDHIIHQRLSYFDKTPIGTATTRTISNVEAVNDTFSEGLITIVADILTILFIVCFMLYTSWKLTLVSLAVLPALLFVTRWFQDGVKRSFQDERTQIERISAFLQEHISGMRIIRIFGVEEREQKNFEAINMDLRTANIKGIWYYSLFFPAVEICLAIAIGSMVWYASQLILQREVANVGIISAFILYITMLFRPLRFIADKVNTIQRGVVAAERVFKLLDKNESVTNTGTYVPAKVLGSISFKHVWFAYHAEDYVLKDVSFELSAGETLAIVGATGSGKTSTISLLGRFYEINKGEICIDGRNISHYELGTLRKQMSIVLQDVFLFAGTVFDNITLRNANITYEQVERAAKLVGAHDFISKLPGGYHYKVMERGATLSMGQRQLISFVRALVYDPRILILDEATSSIDSESEALIQHAIETLVKGRTSVVIAHRLSTIRHAHKILVMDKGVAVEFGTHEQLLAINGRYKQLYDMQYMKQEAEQH